MQIKIWYRPASKIPSVAMHAWDQNGQVWDVPGTLEPDGLNYTFLLSGATQDQRDVSFRYRFASNQWEDGDWTRTVPTTDAKELWTQAYSGRCALQAPGAPVAFPFVTIHAITLSRFNGGAVYVWPQSTPPPPLYYQSTRDDPTQTSTFVVPLTGGWSNGFYFKLVGHGSDMKFGDFEPDNATRFWQPSDGAEVWVKSGEPDVQSEVIVPYVANVDFVFPLAFGTPNLRIQDIVGDFDNTFSPAFPAPTAIDALFSTMRYAIAVYTGALYNVWWTIESRGLARRFRIPPGGTTDPSIAVNGYDHWLDTPPVRNSSIDLVIHPNPSTAFGISVPVQVGVGTALSHETVTANSRNGTWVASLQTFPGIPFWAMPTGESRVDGPLDFRRGIMGASTPTTVHTVDGVAGATTLPPAPFLDPPAGSQAVLMKAVYGAAVVDAGVFDSWEMPHGVNKVGDRVFFVVRAPHAMSCSLVLMAAPNPKGTPRAVKTVSMSLTRDLRYWWVSIPAASAPNGMLYRFAYTDGRELLDPRAGYGESLDPACRAAFNQGTLTVNACSGAEQSWSLVTDLDLITQPMQGSAWPPTPWNTLLIYEMHAKRFTQRNAATSDFDQVVQELQGGYLSRLPVTALEFLPLHEFPGNQAGWGYNPSLFFAIESDYGGPVAFAKLARVAHDSNRSMIVDLVYNHLVDSPLQALARDVYVSGATQWGDMVNFSHPACCEFFRQATVYLWKYFRLDGLRFDSTETIVNGGVKVDSTRFVIATGPDGNYLLGNGKGWEFLDLLRTALRRAADASRQGWPYLVGENDPENPGMTDPSSGVLDGQWHFIEMYAINSAAQNRDDHSSDVRGGLDGSGQPFQRSVVYGESHDTVSGQGWTKRIAATENWGNGRQMSKAVGAVSLLSRGIPMIFMGEEASEDQPFSFGNDPTMLGFTLRLDDYEARGSECLQVLTWFRDLMGLRGNSANGLQGDDSLVTGQGYKTVAFTRASDQFFIVVTFGTSNQQQNTAWLGLPAGASYKEIFNSSWPKYQVHAEPQCSNGGYAAQLNSGDLINLPAIGAVVLQRR
jgi:1,4-alpha-glucan branching enzyme